MIRWRAATALAALLLLAACQGEQAQRPTRANFAAAIDDYLAQRGHLCLARYDWPTVVPDADRAVAQQMVLLESLGLATARGVASAATPSHEYALTPEGGKYYLHVPVVVRTPTRHVTHPADFCVARLTLDRLFGWETPRTLGGRTVSSVLFSYQVHDRATWLATPDARRAFPLAMRAIDNAGTLQLRLGVHLTPHGWVADELSE